MSPELMLPGTDSKCSSSCSLEKPRAEFPELPCPAPPGRLLLYQTHFLFHFSPKAAETHPKPNREQ